LCIKADINSALEGVSPVIPPLRVLQERWNFDDFMRSCRLHAEGRVMYGKESGYAQSTYLGVISVFFFGSG
jgi:hypothetical protein